MILHPDGTIEGTPEEVAAYKRTVSENATTQLVTEGRIRQPDIPFPQANVDIRAKQQQGCFVNEGSTERKELTEEQVSSLSTYRLTEELEKRGVHVTKISPAGTFTLVYEDGCAGGNIPFSGPAVILVNQD